MGGGAGKVVDDLIARLRRYRARLAAEQRHSEAAYVDEAIAEASDAERRGDGEDEPRES